MTEYEEAVEALQGRVLPTDVVYRLTRGEQVEYVSMYNDEITGVSRGLDGVLKYGDNAYYWLAGKTPAIAKLGWSGKMVPHD